MDSSLQFRVITSFSDLLDIDEDWYQLWSRYPHATVFQSPDWLLPWTEIFAHDRLWVIEIRRKNVLVGLAPLFIYGTNNQRIVAALGAGISDYLDILIDPEFPDTGPQLARFLNEHSSNWTELQITDLLGSSALLQRELLEQFSATAAATKPQPCDICPQLDLSVCDGAIKPAVPGKQVKNFNAARRMLGDGKIELASRETLDEFLNALFRLHYERWRQTGQAGVLNDPCIQQLYRRATSRLLDHNMLRLFGLRQESTLIACLLAFAERDTFRLYMQGFDPSWAHFSPGLQLIGTALERAVREKKATADFMRGREAYKYYWGCHDVPTFSLQIPLRRVMQTNHSEKSAA